MHFCELYLFIYLFIFIFMTTKKSLKLICDNLIFLGALSTLPIIRLSTILKYLLSLFKK
jgi:hypothetical protein